jgi:transcriptional regulator GlxA family with amidase domain
VDPLVDWVVGELTRLGRHSRPVHDLAADLGVDERTLHRRCANALGYGPKTLQRILRFRRALRLGRSGLPLATIAWEAGYADQAHLTRECGRLAGATPANLFTDPTVVFSATAAV